MESVEIQGPAVKRPFTWEEIDVSLSGWIGLPVTPQKHSKQLPEADVPI
jgi:hypothetical protein